MNNTMKKGIMLLVLAVLTAGGVFAQRVGDTVKVGGNDYRLEEVRGDGKLLLQPVPTLNGVWESPGGFVITINGSTGVYNQFSSTSYVQDAVNKRLIKAGDQGFRNLSSTGALTWSGQGRGFRFNTNVPDVCTGVEWYNCTITLNADNQSFQYLLSGVTQPTTYTRRR
jgi:hypothetical protein